jgi:hypothetical protein
MTPETGRRHRETEKRLTALIDASIKANRVITYRELLVATGIDMDAWDEYQKEHPVE